MRTVDIGYITTAFFLAQICWDRRLAGWESWLRAYQAATLCYSNESNVDASLSHHHH